jgi:hypothetical protein
MSLNTVQGRHLIVGALGDGTPRETSRTTDYDGYQIPREAMGNIGLCSGAPPLPLNRLGGGDPSFPCPREEVREFPTQTGAWMGRTAALPLRQALRRNMGPETCY